MGNDRRRSGGYSAARRLVRRVSVDDPRHAGHGAEDPGVHRDELEHVPPARSLRRVRAVDRPDHGRLVLGRRSDGADRRAVLLPLRRGEPAGRLRRLRDALERQLLVRLRAPAGQPDGRPRTRDPGGGLQRGRRGGRNDRREAAGLLLLARPRSLLASGRDGGRVEDRPADPRPYLGPSARRPEGGRRVDDLR